MNSASKQRVCGVSAVLALAGLVGCSGVAAESVSDEATASTSQALWSVGSDSWTKEWNSGKTDNLSDWKEISCYSTYGSDFLLTGLQAFQDSGSADNYIARLRGKCSGHTNLNGAYVQDGRHETELVFSSDYKGDGDWTEVASEDYPAGVVFEADLWNDYVKTLRFETVHQNNPGLLGPYENPSLTPAVGPSGGPIIGPLHYLECPDEYVVTAFSLKYDTKKGKIRHVKITCRPLTD